MRSVRQVGIIGSAVVAVVIVLAGMAWACTEYARIVSVSPGEVPAGAKVQVVGQGFTSANELRIADRVDNGKVAGRALAFVNTPNFSVAVEIPRELAPGEYYLVGYGYDDQGQVKGQFSVPLTVLPATSAPTDPSGTTSETGEPAPAPAPAPTAESASTPGPVVTAPVTPSPATQATATAAPSSSSTATPVAADQAAVSEAAPVASPGAAVPVAGAGPSAATSGSAARTAADGQQGAVSTAAPALPVGEAGEGPAPLAGVTNGLWGGFAPGEDGGFGLSTGEVPTAPVGGGAGVGIVVLGGGAAALLGAGAVAVAQRRRAKATA